MCSYCETGNHTLCCFRGKVLITASVLLCSPVQENVNKLEQRAPKTVSGLECMMHEERLMEKGLFGLKMKG